MQSEPHGAEPRRLHPATLLFNLVGLTRAFLIPGLVLLFAGRGRGQELIIMLLAIPALITAIAKYLSLRYQLTETELVVREGILGRKERHIPFERIQNIDTTRNVLHRMLGVADVNVQTASGSKPEAKLQVLSLDAVEIMRNHVLSRRQALSGPITDRFRPARDIYPAVDGPTGDVSVATEVGSDASAGQPGLQPRQSSSLQGPQATTIGHLSIRSLLLLGIISNRGMVALAAVIGVISQVELLPSEQSIERLARSIPLIGGWSLGHAIGLAALGVIAGVIVLRLLSMAWAVVALYDFTLSRNHDELRSRFGLLTQRTATIPRHRIQLVQIEEGLLHRLFKQVAVRARTAGSGTGEQSGLKQDWLMPLLRSRDLPDLLLEAHPGLESPGSLTWQRLPARAIRRLRNRQLFLMLPAAAGAAFLGLAWALAIWSIIALTAWQLPRLVYRARRWVVTDTALWYRSGWLVRTTRIVRFSKIQSVGLIESPFDRRHGMRTLTVDTANAGVGRHAITIAFLEAEQAESLAARLNAEASATTFRW